MLFNRFHLTWYSFCWCQSAIDHSQQAAGNGDHFELNQLTPGLQCCSFTFLFIPTDIAQISYPT